MGVKTQLGQGTSASAHRLHTLEIIGGFLDGQTFGFAYGLNCITFGFEEA